MSWLKLGSQNWNSDSNSEIAMSWLKLGFENWNSDSNSEVGISWLKLGFENEIRIQIVKLQFHDWN